MNYLYPLNAVHKDGKVLLLYTLKEVHSFIKKYGRFHDVYGECCPYSYTRYIEYHAWIVRDDRGCIVKYDDVCYDWRTYYRYNKRQAEIRKIAEKGLPIPYTGCSKAGRKMNHTAKKNSGKGHRNRNRALCEYDCIVYGIPNKYGKPRPWEGY